MDDGSSTYMLIMMLAMVVLSAFFSASETAYSSLNQIRLKSRAESGDAQARKVLALSKRYDNLLSTILIGNNIVNIALSSMGTVLFTRILGGSYGPTVSTVVITIAVLIFGEITPKSLAKEMPEKFAIFSAPVLNMLVVLFTPLNFIFGAWKKLISRFFGGKEVDVVTDAELLTMVGEAENDGELTDRESELIRSAIEFDDVEVGQILTPRVDVVAVSDEDTMEELAQTFETSGYSRLPVYHETIDNIIGVIHEKDFHAAMRKKQTDISKVLGAAMYTTKTTQISELLRQFKAEQHHLAVVVDEYGGTSGIVTLEDIIEELVGEIWDEHDEAIEEFRLQSDGSWLVAGSASVADLYEELSIPEDEEISSMTVSGLVQEATSRLPKVGDKFSFDRYDGEVTRAAHRRVLEVRLRENPAFADKGEKDD